MSSADQSLSLSVTDKGVFLQVAPDAELTLTDAIRFVTDREIEDYDNDALLEAVNERSGEPVRIAERRPDLDRPANIEVSISEDGLRAELRMLRPLGKPWPTVDELKAALQEQGVTFGVKEDALQRIVDERLTDQWVTVAEGQPPKEGKDTEFVYKVETNPARPKEIDKNRVDMKNLGTVVNVLEGQELVEKIPHVPAEDGTSVLGKPIKARQTKDKSIPAGKNTTLSEDGLHLYTAMDGHVSVKEGKVHISPVYEVPGDVDYSTGNIEFVGDVTIKGTVREGFDVTAGGNIIVNGVVEGATISCEGTVTLKSGIRGMSRGRIQARGNIICTYCGQAWVRSEGDIFVAEAIMHSDIGAKGTIDAVQGGKGLIVGGKVQAGRGVRCETLGNDMGTKTEVVVGQPPKLKEQYETLQRNQEEVEGKLSEISGNLTFLKKIESLGKLDEKKRQVMLKLTRAKFQLQAQQKNIAKQLETLEQEIEGARKEGKVEVRGTVHSGTSIAIRGVKYLVREDMHSISFVYHEGEVKPQPLR
ncbi:MAG: FapA family protein [Synergistales bacterium]|nr:FapA family protein [Synergistales bacterium]